MFNIVLCSILFKLGMGLYKFHSDTSLNDLDIHLRSQGWSNAGSCVIILLQRCSLQADNYFRSLMSCQKESGCV